MNQQYIQQQWEVQWLDLWGMLRTKPRPGTHNFANGEELAGVTESHLSTVEAEGGDPLVTLVDMPARQGESRQWIVRRIGDVDMQAVQVPAAAVGAPRRKPGRPPGSGSAQSVAGVENSHQPLMLEYLRRMVELLEKIESNTRPRP
jgi:hypothetical protein